MRKHLGFPLALIGGVALAALWSPHPAAAETIKIAHSTWVGYGPLYIAREKGFFKNHGVDVESIVIEEPKERFPAMLAGRIDMIASTVDTAILYLKKPDDFQYVVAIDDSNGGDGIIHQEGHQNDRRSEGQERRLQRRLGFGVLPQRAARQGRAQGERSEARQHGGTGSGRGLRRQQGRCRRHLGTVALEGQGDRFRAPPRRQLDDAGLITDVIITTKDFTTKHAKETKGIVDAWNDAVAFARANPGEGNEIMAKGVGGWLKDPKVFAETLEGVKLYGGDDNKKFFGTKDKPGLLTDTVHAGDSTSGRATARSR